MRSAMLLALALAAMAGVDARAQDEVGAFQIQGWSGGARFDRTRQSFSHCAVSTVYGGITLSFVLSSDNEFRIEIGADDWTLRPGGDYVATLMIDHRAIQAIASARSAKQMTVEFGPDDEIIKELRDGQFLRVLAEHIGISFSLAGSSQALQRLRTCVTDNRGRVR
jgi:hypothetical protein